MSKDQPLTRKPEQQQFTMRSGFKWHTDQHLQ